MKNSKKGNYLIIILLVVIVVIILSNFFKYFLNTIDKSIMGKNWYKYDNNTGYFEVINFSEKEFKYYRPVDDNVQNEYDTCKNYYFNKKKNELIFDCGNKIRIIKTGDNNVSLEIDGKTNIFFDNIENSLNYEFESYFGKSMIEYKKNKLQAKDFIKINEKKLFEVIKSDEYSKIVFIGDNCNNVDCILALDVLEKWISKTENVYYFDTKELNENILDKLYEIDNGLIKSVNYYDNGYPIVIISNNNKIIDKYEIKCNGFNCSKYNTNEF